MIYKVDNAVIMAAGMSSRFAPISYERPKALIEVKGEILIERQIRQLQQAGIDEIYIIVGYMKDRFAYLKDKYKVILIENNDYLSRNNNASIYAVRNFIRNTYICSSDNYFNKNPFERYVDDSYYSAVYAKGSTNEWCLTEDKQGYIDSVTIGGENAWYMLGHTFWSELFSRRFLSILERVYDLPETENLLWESIYMQHLNELKMRIRKYPADYIFEFDTLDELRAFDNSYIPNTRSTILKSIAEKLECKEQEIEKISVLKAENNAASGFRFEVKQVHYEYLYRDRKIKEV